MRKVSKVLGLVVVLAGSLVTFGCDTATEEASPSGGDTDVPTYPVDDGVEDSVGDRTDEPVVDDDEPAVVAVPAVALNEIVAAPVEGSDWFELVALGPESAVLTGCAVVDDDPDREPQALPEVVLAPGELLVVSAPGEDPGDGTHWVDFKLGKADALTLTCAGEVVDVLDWEDGDAPEGTSWGRLPDGTGEPTTLTPTPGAPNEAYEVPADTPGSPFDPDRVITVELDLVDATWSEFAADAKNETYYEADLVFDGIALSSVAVRPKGNSSLNSVLGSGSDRFSLKVDMNEHVDGQTLLGVKKLNFNNGFKDPTLIREHLAYEMMRALGVPAPRTSYIDLWVEGEHLGLYTMVEHVDDTFCDEHWPGGEGDLYKADHPGGTLVWAGDDLGAYSGLELKTNEETSDQASLLALLATLDEPSGDLSAVLDTDEAVRYLAVSTLLGNLDSYQGSGHNYYLYEDLGVFSVVPWDLNEAFGNFKCGCNDEQLLALPVHEPICGPMDQRPLVWRLLSDPAIRSAHDAYLLELVDTLYPEEVMAARITEIADLIRPWLEQDERKFFTMEQFEAGLGSGSAHRSAGPGGPGQGWSALGLGQFVEVRWPSVRDQLAGVVPSTNGGQGGCPSGGGGPPPGQGGPP